MTVVAERLTDVPVVRAVPDFGAFYRREYRQVLGLAFLLCRDRSAAEDLVQEAFTVAFRDWEEIARMERPDAWVRRVVANRSASRYRRLAVEARAVTRSGVDSADVPEVSVDSVAVWDAIRRLSARQAEAVVLIYYADLSHAEVAEVMGCKVETARTHLKRAKARLTRWLGDNQ